MAVKKRRYSNLTVATKEESCFSSEPSETKSYIVECSISRANLINGQFQNKQERIVQEKLVTKNDVENRNASIVEFLNAIYESILQKESEGLIK